MWVDESTRVILVALYLTLGSAGAREIIQKFEKGGRQQVPGKWPTLTGEQTQIMAHRGEKILMPQHTIGSYTLAAIEGADYVEPDLVLTKDGHLVCFHDLVLRADTNVASLPQYADKMSNFTGVVDEDGPIVSVVDDWFIKDFTLEELKTLNVKQHMVGIRPQLFNELFKIPTFKEYLDTVHHNAFLLNKSVGVIPELKHPNLHNQIFNTTPHFMEHLVVDTLASYGYPMTSDMTPNCSSAQDSNATISCGHLILQSFEFNCIKYLNNVTNVDKMILISPYGPVQFPLMTYQGMREIALYAQYYAVWKEHLYIGIEAQLEIDGEEYDKKLIGEMGGFVPPRDIPEEAHALGMAVGIYTIYDSREPSNRGCGTGNCDPENKDLELFYYFDLGVDGMFVENVPEARELRLKYYYEVVERNSELPSSTGKGNTGGSGKHLPSTSNFIFGLVILLVFRRS